MNPVNTPVYHHDKFLIKDIIKQEIAELSNPNLKLKPQDINTEASVLAYGIDSVRGIELMIALEERLGIELPDPDLSKNITVGDMICFIEDYVKAYRQRQKDS